MSATEVGGYARSILRVDLSSGKWEVFSIPEEELRMFVGGTGLGALLLYREVPPGVGCLDPANRLIMASGPLGGHQRARLRHLLGGYQGLPDRRLDVHSSQRLLRRLS
mgnify:CR=1 FL=1